MMNLVDDDNDECKDSLVVLVRRLLLKRKRSNEKSEKKKRDGCSVWLCSMCELFSVCTVLCVDCSMCSPVRKLYVCIDCESEFTLSAPAASDEDLGCFSLIRRTADALLSQQHSFLCGTSTSTVRTRTRNTALREQKLCRWSHHACVERPDGKMCLNPILSQSDCCITWHSIICLHNYSIPSLLLNCFRPFFTIS